MAENPTIIPIPDNGGRRRIRDRRFLISVSREQDRRTNWERRSGYDRRLRRITGILDNRRQADEDYDGQLP